MPERGALLARMPGSGVPGPVKSNNYSAISENLAVNTAEKQRKLRIRAAMAEWLQYQIYKARDNDEIF